MPESKAPSVEVTVCGTLSSLFQETVVPVAIVTSAGLNARLTMRTVVASGRDLLGGCLRLRHDAVGPTHADAAGHHGMNLAGIGKSAGSVERDRRNLAGGDHAGVEAGAGRRVLVVVGIDEGHRLAEVDGELTGNEPAGIIADDANLDGALRAPGR